MVANNGQIVLVRFRRKSLLNGQILERETESLAYLLDEDYFFSISVFFYGHWQLTKQQGKGMDQLYSFLPLPTVHLNIEALIYINGSQMSTSHF